ncbi:U3 small nucleolar RNA-associated protein 18-like protein [Acromyrmex echinatior]|uniref:U3 small nucleolar RNA-associated protein 18-like protein n=1 Tax=Acromyrmex echinatior TaxID=103372 RepID=F4WBJ8_ACREC|nr:U3 small nucleolar RNA-associated protein 18-like protein [Acromyrmex echinatior]
MFLPEVISSQMSEKFGTLLRLIPAENHMALILNLNPLDYYTLLKELPMRRNLHVTPFWEAAVVNCAQLKATRFRDRIEKVDGHTNNKLHSMQFKKYPISKAIFMKEGTEILLGSQYYPYCHTYDLMNGKTYKFSLPHRITNMKRYEVSPDGKLIALCGRLGEIYLLHSFTKELVGTFRMNSKCRVLAFTPDSKTLISHGDGSEMYIWDLNTRTCINRAIDDGSLSCTSLAVSPSGQFVATGSAQGVVNLYDMKTVLEDQSPAPLKIWMNLVTSVTSLKFNLTSEILTAASVDKYNAFRMMHLPSFTVFSNFPTLQTNIGMSQTINFSPGSGYLNSSYRILEIITFGYSLKLLYKMYISNSNNLTLDGVHKIICEVVGRALVSPLPLSTMSITVSAAPLTHSIWWLPQSLRWQNVEQYGITHNCNLPLWGRDAKLGTIYDGSGATHQLVMWAIDIHPFTTSRSTLSVGDLARQVATHLKGMLERRPNLIDVDKIDF